MAEFSLTVTPVSSLAGTTLTGSGLSVGTLTGTVVSLGVLSSGGGGTGSGSVTSVGTGGGLTGGPVTSSGTISHADTSTQANITATANTYVDGLTFDTYGHVTGVTTVAGFDGDYSSLTNTPTLGTAAAAATTDFATASHTHAISDVTNLQTELNGKVDTSSVGIANGVAELDSNGLVPTSQLPSYVDDVLEYANFASFPGTGEAGKIYVDLATNDIYRWGGTQYIKVNDAVSTADQATQLATARTIELTGDVTGSTTFDGSANVQISTTSASGSGGFPSGTAMLFQQSAAPTGWTKQTTHNNKALRVVSGTASSGGNVAFTTAFSASRTVSGSVADHTLILSEIPSHNHGAGTLEAASHTHSFSGGSYNVSRFDGDFAGARGNNVDREAPNEGDFTQFTITVPNSTGASGALGVSGSTADAGGDGSHNHGWSGSVNIDVQYVDLIIATKD